MHCYHIFQMLSNFFSASFQPSFVTLCFWDLSNSLILHITVIPRHLLLWLTPTWLASLQIYGCHQIYHFFSEFLEQKSVGDRLMYAFLWFPFLSRSAAGTCSFCGGARVLQQATRPHQIFLTEQILRKEQLSWKGTQMYLAEIMKVRLFLWLLLGAVHTL